VRPSAQLNCMHVVRRSGSGGSITSKSESDSRTVFSAPTDLRSIDFDARSTSFPHVSSTLMVAVAPASAKTLMIFPVFAANSMPNSTFTSRGRSLASPACMLWATDAIVSGNPSTARAEVTVEPVSRTRSNWLIRAHTTSPLGIHT
jgi:hypothetical protein